MRNNTLNETPDLKDATIMQDELRRFVELHHIDPETVTKLKGDASTRSYYRLAWRDGRSAVAQVYPCAGEPSMKAYRGMTAFFQAMDVNVPEVYLHEPSLGILVLQDLGDTSLRERLKTANPQERLKAFEEAASLVCLLQREGTARLTPDVPAYHVRFDEAIFMRELTFFHTHFFEGLLGGSLNRGDTKTMQSWYRALSSGLASHSSVLCHRDYHMDNLYLHDGKLFIIDFQDARLGPAAYDLVSLLKDRDVDAFANESMSQEVVRLFLSQTGYDEALLRRQIDLASAQRCLKALGTFASQLAMGRVRYRTYIDPTLKRLHRLFEGRHALPEGWSAVAMNLPPTLAACGR